MSADNGITIFQRENGYEVTEWFGDGDYYSTRGTFPTIEEAIAFGQSIYTEYGLSFVLDDPPHEGGRMTDPTTAPGTSTA